MYTVIIFVCNSCFQTSDDEGFAESLDSAESSLCQKQEEDDVDIWEKALTAKRNQYFRWEDIGW